jgi:hypothetical protein
MLFDDWCRLRTMLLFTKPRTSAIVPLSTPSLAAFILLCSC